MSDDKKSSIPSREERPAEGGSRAGGGFDTMLGRVMIDRGLVSDSELQQAINRRDLDPGGSLADVLLNAGFVTNSQMDRVRSEIESERSTQRIPGYKIMRKLGSGAMATVFLARQISLDRLVAIKVLPRRYSDNADFIARFQKEGRAAAKLNDPNIVAAYDVGNSGDHHYFVMEYVDGDTVYDRITANKRFEESQAISVANQVASALRHAHDRGFIHRDIKPKNVMITKDGLVKLADLGLARALSDKEAAEAEAGRAFGTPFYISPEQIRGKVDIGPQADIYGLGATLYHMVTGSVPFKGKSPSEVMHRHLKEPLVAPDHLNPGLSSGLAQVIEMMMAKDPADRYRNAEELLEDLALVDAGQKPRHAGGAIDIASVVSMGDDAENLAPVMASRANENRSGGLTILLIATLIGSVLLNLALLAFLAGNA
ncbi:MAG: serine/threonine protein kinase [Planctomycetaceae bacterium]|nr:serine/threonine protein kinase [Planctomycetaceae bacterium]